MKELIEAYIEEMTERAEDCRIAGHVDEQKILLTIIRTLKNSLSDES